jgi:hypothetical protein
MCIQDMSGISEMHDKDVKNGRIYIYVFDVTSDESAVICRYFLALPSSKEKYCEAGMSRYRNKYSGIFFESVSGKIRVRW